MTKEEAKEILRYNSNVIHQTINGETDPNEVEALDMAIEALEIVEEFEKAQIITGGRLNGRTYAYKCGLEDGKRKALEQQSSDDDCVSRDAVEFMITGGRYPNEDYEQFIDRLVNELENLPPVTPTQRWVPISEKLPKESDDYLVTISIDIGAKEPVREVCKDFFCILSQQWLYYNEDVVAWQPLPKTYEEKRGNENGSN